MAAISMLAAPAGAATIIGGATYNNSFQTIATLQTNDDLRNNADFSSARRAYVFYESGAAGGDQTLLLHYDRQGGALSFGRVTGYFDILLGLHETLDDVVVSSLGLLATDPNNGVIYQRATNNIVQTGITLLRGLEPTGLPLAGDYLSVVQQGASLYRVNYDFQNNGATQDQARFFISSAAPEPGMWALMIAGFGMMGAMLRRRQVVV